MKACVDPAVRLTETTRTLRDDIAASFDYLATRAEVDPARRSVYAHSEGTYQVTRLVESGRIAPYSLVFMGAVGASPYDTLRHQLVEGSVDQFWEDANGDGVMSRAEIDAGAKEAGATYEAMRPMLPAALTKLWDAHKDVSKRDMLAAVGSTFESVTLPAMMAAPDTSPAPQTGAQLSWFKDWFRDEEPVA
jgi:hypothetical protein